MTQTRPRIGMDRFIAAEWMDLAAEVRRGEASKSDLDARLALDIKADAVRAKTRGILTRMWFSTEGHKLALAALAAKSICDHGDAAKPAAFCAVAMAAYPYFAEVREVLSRILRSHETCSPGDIHRRMFERHGKRTTVDQATSYAFKTMVSWGVLRREADNRLRLPDGLRLNVDTWGLMVNAIAIYRRYETGIASSDPLMAGFRRDK